MKEFLSVISEMMSQLDIPVCFEHISVRGEEQIKAVKTDLDF